MLLVRSARGKLSLHWRLDNIRTSFFPLSFVFKMGKFTNAPCYRGSSEGGFFSSQGQGAYLKYFLSNPALDLLDERGIFGGVV